jgi:hypothetical protein
MDRFMKIDLNRLPEFSPWPGRIMGIEEWKASGERDKAHILREYGEKWGSLLEVYQNQSFADLKQALDFLFETHFPQKLLFHINEDIYYSDTDPQFWSFFYAKIIDVLNRYMSAEDSIVELGCGWGRNLFYFLHSGICRGAVGGEYTPEGLKLGELIKDQFNLPIEFHYFDFKHPGQEFLKKVENKVVFTHNSIEQVNFLPKDTVLSLAAASPKVVIHFEPVYEYRDKVSLLHFLWKRYTEMNDYNRNLATVLRELEKEGKIEIIFEQIHYLGLNAFNPGSIIAWRPKGK